MNDWDSDDDWNEDEDDWNSGEEHSLDDDEFDYDEYVRQNHEPRAVTDLPKIWQITAIGLLAMILLFWVFFAL